MHKLKEEEKIYCFARAVINTLTKLVLNVQTNPLYTLLDKDFF